MATFDHFERLGRLLEMEAKAEGRRLAELAARQTGDDAERSGQCLVKLAIRDEQPAFGDRVTVTLAKRDQTQELPWNRLGMGTPVLLTEEGVAAVQGWRGVVSRRDRASIDVVLAESPEARQSQEKEQRRTQAPQQHQEEIATPADGLTIRRPLRLHLRTLSLACAAAAPE